MEVYEMIIELALDLKSVLIGYVIGMMVATFINLIVYILRR